MHGRNRDDHWPSVGVVVVNWNSFEDTAECLDSLRSVEYPDYEVVVVDNGSTDGSGDRLTADFDWCEVVVNEENLGFAGGCNAGIERALENDAEYVLLLNNDATVEEEFLKNIVGVADDPDVDVVGALIEDDTGHEVNPSPSDYPDMFFYSGYRENLPINPFSRGRPRGRSWPTDRVEGAGVLLPRNLLHERQESVGHFLDESLFMYCEEVELAMWCRERGKRSVVTRDAVVHHDSDASSSRSFQLYYLTRNRILIADRYFDGIRNVFFAVLYAASRVALAVRFLRRGERGIARAIFLGLVDGFFGVDGQRDYGFG